MTVTVLDGEWSVRKYTYTSPYTGRSGERIDGTPYCRGNKLVFLGLTTSDGTTGGAFFEHQEIQHKYTTDGKEYKKGSFQFVQDVLDRTKLLVGHNLKADLSWILESGFKLPDDIQIFDTMTFEYVANKAKPRGKGYFTLKECCDRRGVKAKLDIILIKDLIQMRFLMMIYIHMVWEIYSLLPSYLMCIRSYLRQIKS